jgi:hypothetical protein
MSVKDDFAAAWAEDLAGRLSLPVFPQRRDGNPPPPYAVVVVRDMQQTVSGSNTWLAEVRIVVITDVAQNGGASSNAHKAASKAVYAAIEGTMQKCVDVSRGVIMCGFNVDGIEEVRVGGPQGEKVYGDVYQIVAGVKGLS